MKQIQDAMMEHRNLNQVKELINELDDYDRVGPPTEEQVMQMRALTGVNWTAEELRRCTFEYESRASLEETAYLMFHRTYPPIHEAELVFWKCKDNMPLDNKEIYTTYQFGRGTLDTLEALPYSTILQKITEAFPDWKQSDSPDTEDIRFDSPDQTDYWSDTHFWIFEYGRETDFQREHQILVFICHNMNDEQINLILKCMAGFECPLRIREEKNQGNDDEK